MESIKIKLLENVIGWLTGGGAYLMIKSVVDQFMNEEMSGEDKKKAVKAILMPVLATISGVLLNLAIEIAVLALKNAAGDKDVLTKG